jgi:hypothetical protein
MAECAAGDQGPATTSVNRRPLPIDVEVVGGPVSFVDQAYAWEELALLWRLSPRAVKCGCAHLCAGFDDDGRSVAAADAFLVLDDDLVICGGAVAAMMRDAINHLSARLRRRVMELRQRDLQSSSRAQATTAGVSR